MIDGIPEAVIEGGIRFLSSSHNFVGNNEPYKSMRLGFGSICYGTKGKEPGTWPLIYGDEMTTWADSLDILIGAGKELCTLLKSFSGAPAFTTAEMKRMSKAFATIGLVTRYTTFNSLKLRRKA